ncbi:hypothetical protein AcW1_001262 [Taiwanofungus camphoratus]|nr:hypothetical protein AcW2_000216 [Antrodia cinnamomea]KAI0931308.1 hypothetical protein AcW2_000230 [Antrodia cinnamomea]KAI0964446.1 hypothetical protein AcW1_001262 [Antrodia cinnamomea]
MRAKQGDNVMKANGAAAVDGAGALATMKIMPRACADATHQWQRGPQRTANHMQARPRDCGYGTYGTLFTSMISPPPPRRPSPLPIKQLSTRRPSSLSGTFRTAV